MEMEHFLDYLMKTKQLEKISHINSDGMPNMKHKYVRDLYQQYLYQTIPSYECSICMETIQNNVCKLKCGHCFCVDCFSNLARTSNNCALCRQEISTEKVKKEIDQTALIDVINYEIEAHYEERNDKSLSEFIYEQAKSLYESESKSDYILTRAVDTIMMEVFDSLHTVGYISMDTMRES